MPRIKPVVPALAALAAVTLVTGVVACGSGGTVPASRAGTTMCQPYGTAAVAGGAYTVQHDEWGSSAAECVSTTGAADLTVTKSALANPADGDPGSYPSIYAGCNWGDCTKGGLTADPLRLNDIRSGAVTTSLATVDPPGGAYDVSYDIWINRTPATSGAPDGLEVMVWLNSHGGVQPAGDQVARGVQAGGHDYDVWYSADAGNGPCVTYVMTTALTTVRNLDLAPLLADAGQRGYADPSWYLIAVEAGFEIWHGGQGLTASAFSVTLDPPAA
jgi:Glycosyl hydrolase family 12